MSKKFKQLLVPEGYRHYWSKYPEGYTILEALLNWVNSVNQLTDNVNDWNIYLEDFVENFDEKLAPTVREMLNEMDQDGRLAEIINDEIFSRKADISYVDDEIETLINDINFKNSKVYYLENFGGKGDGLTNSFPAFISALNEIKNDGGNGTIKLLNGTYLMQPTTSTEINNKPINISEIESLTLTSNGNNAVFKLGEGLKHSDFIYSMNPNQSLIVRDIIFDANAENNPMETGTDPNPRTQAQRMFGIYAKHMIFENNTFRDFYGVNVVIADRHNETEGFSIARFDNNHVENFGRDYSGAVHDTSVFYTHANSFEVDHHTAICTNNTFNANHDVEITNAYNAVELGAKNIIATNNVINGFHYGIITAHQYTTENLLISDNIINGCAFGINPWAYPVTQSTEAIKNGVIKDNSIFIDADYWQSRAVYTSHVKDSGGNYKHDYSGIGFFPSIARDINNLSIEDNLISFKLSNASVKEEYSGIMIDQYQIENEKSDLLYSNVSIKNNKILNAHGKGISIIGKHIKWLKIEENEIIRPLNKKTHSKNVIFIRGREEYSELENIYIMNNIIDLIHAVEGVRIQTEGNVNEIRIENNKWENEQSANLSMHINFEVNNIVENLKINELLGVSKEAQFVNIKQKTNAIYCNIVTPDGTLDETGKITYHLNDIEEIKDRVYYLNDEIIVKNPKENEYKGYICIAAGNKGGWNGYGLVDPTRIDL